MLEGGHPLDFDAGLQICLEWQHPALGEYSPYSFDFEVPRSPRNRGYFERRCSNETLLSELRVGATLEADTLRLEGTLRVTGCREHTYTLGFEEQEAQWRQKRREAMLSALVEGYEDYASNTGSGESVALFYMLALVNIKLERCTSLSIQWEAEKIRQTLKAHGVDDVSISRVAGGDIPLHDLLKALCPLLFTAQVSGRDGGLRSLRGANPTARYGEILYPQRLPFRVPDILPGAEVDPEFYRKANESWTRVVKFPRTLSAAFGVSGLRGGELCDPPLFTGNCETTREGLCKAWAIPVGYEGRGTIPIYAGKSLLNLPVAPRDLLAQSCSVRLEGVGGVYPHRGNGTQRLEMDVFTAEVAVEFDEKKRLAAARVERVTCPPHCRAKTQAAEPRLRNDPYTPRTHFHSPTFPARVKYGLRVKLDGQPLIDHSKEPETPDMWEEFPEPKPWDDLGTIHCEAMESEVRLPGFPHLGDFHSRIGTDGHRGTNTPGVYVMRSDCLPLLPYAREWEGKTYLDGKGYTDGRARRADFLPTTLDYLRCFASLVEGELDDWDDYRVLEAMARPFTLDPDNLPRAQGMQHIKSVSLVITPHGVEIDRVVAVEIRPRRVYLDEFYTHARHEAV